ncbi:sugar ABC transporter permease [Chloroflexi bacterium TSY]|nr:sugar ABC transporter permease [Chloroflexi bacterium TSY]
MDNNPYQNRFNLWSPSNRHLVAYLLMLPAILLTLVVIAYPLLTAADLSLQVIKITQIGRVRLPWSLDNYRELFTSAEFWRSSWITLRLVTIVTLGCFLMGLGTALLVNNRFRGRSLARILVALPWAVPAVLAAVIWWWMFDSSFGLINWLLVKSGLISSPVAWFSQPLTAFTVICVVMIWKGYPFVSVMVLAGLQAISEDLYEAASIDGANSWGKLRYITLPSLRPILGVALVLVLLWVFRDFPIIFLLTGGGPIGSTRTLAIMTYEQGFGVYNIGYAAAIGMVTLMISLITSLFLIRRVSSSVY